jgi:hypothetical protein
MNMPVASRAGNSIFSGAPPETAPRSMDAPAISGGERIAEPLIAVTSERRVVEIVASVPERAVADYPIATALRYLDSIETVVIEITADHLVVSRANWMT